MTGYQVLDLLRQEAERGDGLSLRIGASRERVVSALNEAIAVGLAFDVITAQHSELRLLKAELERSRRAE